MGSANYAVRVVSIDFCTVVGFCTFLRVVPMDSTDFALVVVSMDSADFRLIIHILYFPLILQIFP